MTDNLKHQLDIARSELHEALEREENTRLQLHGAQQTIKSLRRDLDTEQRRAEQAEGEVMWFKAGAVSDDDERRARVLDALSGDSIDHEFAELIADLCAAIPLHRRADALRIMQISLAP